MGIHDEDQIAKNTVKSGLFTMVLCGGIYLGIIALGTMSLNRFGISENGGIALTQIVQSYFGKVGLIFIALMTLLAVFTSAMGLIASFAQDFSVRSLRSAIKDGSESLHYFLLLPQTLDLTPLLLGPCHF